MSDHYPLSVEQVRERQQKRRDQRCREIRSHLNALTHERDEIQADYQRVSDIYARHLERLNRKAARNVLAMQSLVTSTNNLVAATEAAQAR